jgi:threonine dehydrogenase-like Zn-dependent dehydrogenase
MRALAVFPEQRKVAVIEEDEPPALGPRQVLLRTREVGVCGTDREVAAFAYGERPAGSDHLVLGHEAIAEVVDLGSEVSHFQRGQLAVPTVRRPCAAPRCRPCRAGRQDFCVTDEFLERGIKGADGFLAELFVEEEQNLIPVPPGLAEVGVLIEPLTVIAKGIVKIRALKERLPWEPMFEKALVLGAGAVGLLSAMCAVSNGYDTTVYSRERSDGERAAYVRAFGARYFSSVETPLADVGRRIGLDGPFDLVVEAAGFSPLTIAGLEVLGPNGIAVLKGVPGLGPERAIDIDRLLRGLVLKNQLVFGTVNAGRSDYFDAIHLLEALVVRFPESVRQFISGRYPLEAAPELLSKHQGIKNVVRFDGPSPRMGTLGRERAS